MFERLPPHAPEMEQCLLGALLLDGVNGIGRCRELFRSEAKIFYDPRHQRIFDAIDRMADAGEPIELPSVAQKLRDAKALDAVGGEAYLVRLAEAAGTPASLDYYARIVLEKYLLRRLIATCSELIQRAYEEPGEAKDLLDRAEQEVLAVRGEEFGGGAGRAAAWIEGALQRVQRLYDRKGEIDGLPSGFPDLDRMTDGLHPGEMFVIAARPSMGKTSLAMNIAEHVAVEVGAPTGVFSLEMTGESLVFRLLCSMAQIDPKAIRNADLGKEDFRRLSEASDRLKKAPLFIDDTPALTIGELRARARRMAHEHGVKLIVVDYLQLLRAPSTRRGDSNRQQEIAEISSGIKSLAKELRLPALVLSQLNRELERDRTRKPRLSDLRESGAIEQDADVVGLLYRADPNNPSKPASMDAETDDPFHEDFLPINLLIAKQRNGPTGDIHLIFHRPTTRFAARADHDAAALAQL